MADPPPQPPPHGANPRPPGAMPDGNYDIFIIPPSSAGSGFLYLPSLGTQRNSFLAGIFCACTVIGIWILIVPALKQWWLTIVASGGIGVALLALGVGVAGWAWGKTQGENSNPFTSSSSSGSGSSGSGSTNASGANQQQNREQGQGQQYSAPPPPPPPRADAPPKPSASSSWEKAREETRKREEARKKEEELKKKTDELKKKREEAERQAKANAEKDKWEQARAREKEQRERAARERIAMDKLQREREAREKGEQARGTASARASPSKPMSGTYRKPTAKSVYGTEDEYSFRPYDNPSPKKSPYKSAASSVSGRSDGSSFAPTATTARTTPPPSQRGPYSTKDPEKIQIKAVYAFSDSFPTRPLASLVSNQPPVTDGLILRIKTEGLFLDDDIRGVPQREWDVKAWTLKLVEDGMCKTTVGAGFHVLRATARDAENKKYVFVLDETEAWKVALGLGHLRKGTQVRALGMSGMKDQEVRQLLNQLGWL